MKNECRDVKIGKKYKHFKGKYYRVYNIYNVDMGDIPNMDNYRLWGTPVINALTDEYVNVYVTKWELNIPSHIIITDLKGNLLQGKHVFYSPLYEHPKNCMFVREYNNFLSERDKIKYPNYTQEYRFEYNDL